MKTLKLVCEIDPYELACQILEGLSGHVRPANNTLTSKEWYETIDDPQLKREVMAAARRAFDYVQSRLEVAARVQ